MKLFVVPLLFLGLTAAGQDKPEPSVVFLSPGQVVIDDSLKAELSAYDREMEITDEVRKTYIPENLAPSWKTVRQKELDFIRQQNFVTVLVIAVSRELTYREVQYHDTPLIYPIKIASASDKARYKNLANSYNASWLVNLQKVTLQQQGAKKSIEMSVELYNVMTDRIFLSKTYAMDSSAAGSCQDDVWYCLAEEIKKGIAHDLSHQIDKNRHYHK